MFYEEKAIYHVYNRSNQLLYHNRDNYIYFLKLIRKHILPYSEILAYCLMPNHFHLLLMPNEKGIEFSTLKFKEEMQLLPKSIGTMLSSFVQAINHQQNTKGSLFAHKTKA